MKLDKRITELVAVGASVTASCQPCLKYHVRKALESGADQQEVAEAIEIGKLVRKGAAANLDKFEADLNLSVPVAVTNADAGCGCAL